MVVSQWKERLEHVRLLARMIVLEGNVSDMFIQENGLEAGRLVELDQYLYQYLVDAGYHAVVFLIESILSIILMIEPAKC